MTSPPRHRPAALLLAFAALLAALTGSLAKAAEEHPAQVLVRDNTQQILTFLDEHRENLDAEQELIDAKVAELILPHLDFDAMTKLAVGKHWRDASREQRERLTAEFRKLLVRTYTKSLTEYSGQSIEFLPYRPNPREDRAVVASQFTQTNGQSIGVVYRLRQRDGWRVYDISIDGISLVTNYRTNFSQEVQRNGIDGLIASLAAKNTEL